VSSGHYSETRVGFIIIPHIQIQIRQIIKQLKFYAIMVLYYKFKGVEQFRFGTVFMAECGQIMHLTMSNKPPN